MFLCIFSIITFSTPLLILWNNEKLVKKWTLFPPSIRFLIARIRVRVRFSVSLSSMNLHDVSINLVSPRKSPMLCIKPIIKHSILNYYIPSVIFVCRLELFIVPFHYNCTLCLLSIPRRPSIKIIISHLIH